MMRAYGVEVERRGPGASLFQDVIYVAAASPAGARKRAKEVVSQYTVLLGSSWHVMNRVYEADWMRLTSSEQQLASRAGESKSRAKVSEPKMLKAGDIRSVLTGMWGSGERSWAVYSDPYTYTLFPTKEAAVQARKQMFSARRKGAKRFIPRKDSVASVSRAASDGRRGTGHIHPPGPRKCPKCGV